MKWCPMNRDEICLLLTDKIKHLKNNENKLNELLPDVRLLHGTEPAARTPVMYQPGIIFLFSGHKIGYINEPGHSRRRKAWFSKLLQVSWLSRLTSRMARFSPSGSR